MKYRMLFCLLAVALLAGCVKVDVPDSYRFDFGGDDKKDSDSSDTHRDSYRPSQVPDGGNWTEVLRGVATSLGGHIVGAERGFVYYAFDSLAYPGKSVPLTVRLQEVSGRKVLKDVEGAVIEFRHDGKALGTARTDEDGYAAIEWTPKKKGTYRFEAVVTSAPRGASEEATELTPAPFVVTAAEKKAHVAIIDLDHTVYDAPFWRFLLTGAGRPMKNSVRVTQRIDKDYTLTYLTHRPDLLTAKSKSWLTDHEYPLAPLLVAELEDAMDSGAFKTGKIKALKKWYPKAALGIGDKISDAQAYIDNGLTAYLIPHYDPEDPDEMRQVAGQIDAMRGRGRLQVVTRWEQIEAGIFEGKKFPPGPFVKWLRNQADRVARRQREDDDDEDDEDDDDD